jgi:micrococcal nuclease
MKSPSYTYRAIITNAVDGDTVDANVDLGFGASLTMRLRLLGVNAPEVVGEDRAAGMAAETWLAERLVGRQVMIETHKDRKGRDRKDKWSRYLAVIWLDGININAELVGKGHAKWA